MSESLRKQREALICSIKESEKREKQRIDRLAQTKSKHYHTQLYERFVRDRQLEQEKIEFLMNDYKVLQEKLQSGEENLQQFFQNRTTQKLQHPSAESPFGENQSLPNRFEGLEDHVDIIFFENVVKKFNKYDRKFEAKLAYKPYDPVREERKLKLLTQKRELLNRLISVHKVAEYSNNNSSYNNSNNTVVSSNNNSYRNQDSRSVASSSRSSSSSNASYATFGVNKSQTTAIAPVGGGSGDSRSGGGGSGGGRPPMVPRLKIGG